MRLFAWCRVFSPWEKRRERAQRKVDFFSWVCLLFIPYVICGIWYALPNLFLAWSNSSARTLFMSAEVEREVFEVQVLVRHYLCPFLIPMVTNGKINSLFYHVSHHSSIWFLKKLWIYRKNNLFEKNTYLKSMKRTSSTSSSLPRLKTGTFEKMNSLVKWGASSRWSFGPNSTCDRIETSITGKTHSI